MLEYAYEALMLYIIIYIFKNEYLLSIKIKNKNNVSFIHYMYIYINYLKKL